MDKENLINDLRKTLGTKIKRIKKYSDAVDVELIQHEVITAYDLPHLLTIASGYNAAIKIYPIDEDHLGLYVTEV